MAAGTAEQAQLGLLGQFQDAIDLDTQEPHLFAFAVYRHPSRRSMMSGLELITNALDGVSLNDQKAAQLAQELATLFSLDQTHNVARMPRPLTDRAMQCAGAHRRTPSAR